MKDIAAKKFSTRSIHAGQSPDGASGAIMTPVFQTSTYAQSSPGVFKGRYEYSRTANPTRTALEENLASLEGGKFAVAFSSGLAATSTIFQTLPAGAHVIGSDDMYGGTYRLLSKIFARVGITFTQVNFANLEELQNAIRPETRLLVLETPTNPLLKIADIRAVAKTAKERGVLLAVDNTFASPYLQNPLELGADLVFHSTTKYIGGHSDLVGGVVVTNDEKFYEELLFLQNGVGAVPSPWDCFLLLRSTKTLAVRMERHCQNASQIALKLSEHPDIEVVHYPGLPSHPHHELAKSQMGGFGGMISIVVRGGLTRAKRFLEELQIFTLAESLGGVESLAEHPGIMTHASVPKEQREALGIVDGFVRLSVGIEDVQDLWEDLLGALERSGKE